MEETDLMITKTGEEIATPVLVDFSWPSETAMVKGKVYLDLESHHAADTKEGYESQTKRISQPYELILKGRLVITLDL